MAKCNYEITELPLQIAKGRYKSISLGVQVDNVDYPLIPPQKVRFRVMANIEDTSYLFDEIVVETFTDGKATIEILPEMTNDLALGNYNYEIIWERTEEELITIIRGGFILTWSLEEGVVI